MTTRYIPREPLLMSAALIYPHVGNGQPPSQRAKAAVEHAVALFLEVDAACEAREKELEAKRDKENP